MNCKVHEQLKTSVQVNTETFQKRFIISCMEESCNFKKTVYGMDFDYERALDEIAKENSKNEELESNKKKTNKLEK
jgi:hypothetical protein